MLKRPYLFAIGLVAFLSLAVLNLPGPASTRLKLWLGGVFLPMFGVARTAQAGAESAANAVVPRAALLNEVRQLREENSRLRLLSTQADHILEENTRLRAALGWQKQSRWNLKAARVISREPANWWRALRIDLGSRDGVQTNMAVLTSEGLAGRIAEVGYGSSRVVLIGDPNCPVSAQVRQSGDHGMIRSVPGTSLDPNIVTLTYLDRMSSLGPGNDVVTSGLGVLTNGIPIGKIIDTNSVSYGLYTEARIKLSANLKHLDELWVLLQ